MSGAISPLSPDAAVDMTVCGQDLPIDELLYRAVPPRARVILDMFLDQGAPPPAHRRGADRRRGRF